MAVFEIQDASGKTYQIEAPDQSAAMNAFAQFIGTNTQDQPAAAPEPGALYQNLIGYGAIDTPGEYIGNAIGEIGRGIGRGILGAASLPSKGMNVVERRVAGPIATRIGETMGTIDPQVGAALREQMAQDPNSAAFPSGIQAPQALEANAQSTPAEYAGTVGEFIGGGLLFGGGSGANATARAADLARTSIVPGLTSEAAGQATEGTALEPYARFLGGLLGAVGMSGASKVAADRASSRSIAGAPTVSELKSAAGDLYEQARRNGVVASPSQTTQLQNQMMNTLANEGLLSPRGNLASSFPKVTDAARMVGEYSGQRMTPTQMLQMRRTIQNAARSVEPAEARIGSIMLNQFDDFTSPLAPQIAEANQIYRAAMQGSMVEKAIELAGIRAGQFSGSGFENALRTEFRAIARGIAKGSVRASADETALINRIASGGTLENIARDLGKMAPTGVVSGGLTVGIPYSIGNSIGGPLAGAAASTTAVGLGILGRATATAMQRANAQRLSNLARSGGSFPPLPAPRPVLPTAVPGILSSTSQQ